MPSINLYEQRTSASQGLPSGGADAGAYGAATAGAFQNIGQSLDRIGSDEMQRVKAQADEQGRIWAGRAASDTHLNYQQWLEDRKQAAADAVAKGQPVPDITADFLQLHKDKTEAILAMAPNEDAKRYLSQQMDAMKASVGTQAIHAQAGLTREWKLSTAQTTIDNGAKITQFDPGQFQSQLNNVLTTLPRIDPASDSVRATHAKATLSNAAASSVLDRDPFQLRSETGKALGEDGHKGPTGVPWVDAMTTEQVTHWNNAAEVKIRQMLNQKDRDADAARKLAFDETQTARSFVMEGRAMDPAYQDRIRLLTRGTEYEAEATQLIEAANAGAGFGSQTLPRQAAALAASDGKPTNPLEAKHLQQARGIHDAQTAAYTADPWEAAARFQRGVPSVQPVQIQAGQQLLQVAASRVPLMSQIEAASGKPAPLLKPEEVPQAITALQNMSIRDRTETLGQIGATLSAPRLQAFADQLDKGSKPMALTLKLGVDRTVAGRTASELVQIGSQALADKTVKKDDTALAGWRAEIATLVRGTLGDTKAEDDVIDAAYYVRAAQELDGSAMPGFKLSAGADKAIAMVIGSPLDRAGVKTFLPRGMSEAEFDNKAREKLAAGAGQTVFVRGQPMSVESLSQRWTSYGLRMSGKGTYIPSINNAPVTVDKEGRVPLQVQVQ